jgi:hypothetical protein
VLDRHRQDLVLRARAREGRVGVLDDDVDRRQTKRSDRLVSSAPGNSPASQSTWKPLQMPSTGPPSRANSITVSISGEKRAIAPARR